MLETEVRPARTTPYRLWVAVCVVSLALVTVPVVGWLLAGVVLGLAQGAVLHRVAPRLPRVRFLVVTVLAAGVGWAAAGVPPVVLGLGLGAVLGAAQALTLRGVVRHPWRWVAANVAAWPGACVLVGLSPYLGALAGVVVGVVTGLFLPTLSGVSASSRVVLALLASSRSSGLQRALLGLEVRGRVSGRRYRLPVQYAVAPGGLAVVPGGPSRTTWWRNVPAAPTAVEVLREGVWAPASARRLGPGDGEYDAVLAAYLERWPDTPAEPDQPVVLVRLGDAVGGP